MGTNPTPGAPEPLAGIAEPTRLLGDHVVSEWKESLKSLLDETMDKFEVIEVIELAKKPQAILRNFNLFQ